MTSVPRTKIRSQRRGVFQPGEADRRPQVGEYAQFAPQPQQSALRPQMTGEIIERRATDGAQQYRSRSQAGLQRLRGERVFADQKGGAPDRFASDDEFVAKSFSNCFQNADGFVGNFRSDTVAGQGGKVEEHGALLYGGRAPRGKLVILSGAAASQREVAAESKDPYELYRCVAKTRRSKTQIFQQ